MTATLTVVKHSTFYPGESAMYTVKNGRAEVIVRRAWLRDALVCYECGTWCEHMVAVAEYERASKSDVVGIADCHPSCLNPHDHDGFCVIDLT